MEKILKEISGVTSENTFFANDICPYCQRVSLALAASDFNYNYHSVDFTGDLAWIERISPLRKVPVLLIEQGAIFESSAIIRYVNASQNYFLANPDSFTDAMMLSWFSFIDHIHDLARRYFTTSDITNYLVLKKKIQDSFFILTKGAGENFWRMREESPIIYIYMKPLIFLMEILDRYGGGGFDIEQLNIPCPFNDIDKRVNAIFDRSIEIKLMDFLNSFDSVFSQECNVSLT